jgi:hypothetical protein
MTQPSLLVPVLAIAALLTAAPAAAADVQLKLELDANNGLRAEVENFEQIKLEIERKGRCVSYDAPGEVTESGLKVQFGKLGLIDVVFQPTETTTESPPKGCKGKPSVFGEGVFVGTIKFAGERNYVQIEATQAKGSLDIWRESEWVCPRKRGSGAASGEMPVAASPRERAAARKEAASLIAIRRGCGCFFAAHAVRKRKGDGWTQFVGVKFEEREGMEITRATFANAAPASFVFDHEAGTARVDPPQPFTGAGTFKRRPGRDLWRSTLQIPLLGAAPLKVGGKASFANLVRDLPASR